MKNQYSVGRIYGRFSSKPQERGDSKRRQIDGARQYAEKNGIQIAGQPYFDEAVSGKAGANLEKEFGRLLKEAKSGEVILCEALDRLGRQNPFILGKLLYDTVQRGITVIAYQEGKTITKENIDNLDTQFSVFTGAAVGHADNKRKIDRLIETTQAAYKLADQGIQSGTLRKYLPECFRWNVTEKKLEYDEVRAAVIRRIFRMYADGMGKTTICQKLNEEDVPTIYTKQQVPIGERKPWMETSIKKILKNESYAGVLVVKGQRFTCIPQIVERDLFDKVQLLLQRHSTRHGKLNGRINNLFAGIGVCKYCGGTINVNVSRTKTAARTQQHFYRCKNARLHMCPQPHKMLNAKVVELSFFGEYMGGSPETQFGSKNNEIKTQIESTISRIEQTTTAISNLYDMVESGDVEAKRRIGMRQIEKQRLEQELMVLRGSLVETNNLPTLLDEIAKVMDFPATKDIKKAAELVRQFYPKLQAKLSDNAFRKTLVGLLPTIYSKVVFDCINKTMIPILKDGTKMNGIDLKTFEEV